MEIPHITEEYFCTNCNKKLLLENVFKTWDCPTCRNYVHIRIITENKDNACFRIPSVEINSGDLVLIHRDDNFREVFKKIDFVNEVQLNLEKYGAWKIAKNRYILKLDGGWYH
ncbi:hypothetical protein ACF8C4_14075 [Myroides odoratimimus]|uniref:hypothetical protein n=1 Tax=Myroides odoratimimus TaxID=76832 RepID=UPI00370C99A8